MGIRTKISNMRTTSFLLLQVFLIASIAIVATKAGACSYLGLANVRKVIPDNAVEAKRFLHEIEKLRHKDICQYPELQEMPVANLGYKSDMLLGDFLKQLMKEAKDEFETRIWKNWVKNMDNSNLKTIDEVLMWRTKALDDKLEESLSVKLLPDLIMKYFEELAPKQEDLEKIQFNSQDVQEAIRGFACAFYSHDHSTHFGIKQDFNFGEDFEKVMNTSGVDNIDQGYANSLVKKFLTNIIESEVAPMVDKQVEIMKSLLDNMTPEFYGWETFILELLSGENIKFENQLSRYLDNSQNILNVLKPLAAKFCTYKDFLLNFGISNMLNYIIPLVNQAINEDNKIDFKQLIDILVNSKGEVFIKTYLQKIDNIANLERQKIERGDYGILILSNLEFQHDGGPKQRTHPSKAPSSNSWLEYLEEKHNVRAKVLQAGAILYLHFYLL